jgi:hypothetical protein
MTREELIVALEKAERPSRKLDAEVALVVGWKVVVGDTWMGPHGEIAVPEYTTSIDAALTLVPEGWRWAVGDKDDRTDVPWAQVFRTDLETGELVMFAEDDCYPATPALALCIAALKARV